MTTTTTQRNNHHHTRVPPLARLQAGLRRVVERAHRNSSAATHVLTVFEDYVDRCFDLAKSASKLLGAIPRFELACEPECNILCFRVTDPDWTEEKTNNINSQIREAVLKEGRFYIVQTVVQGKRFLRTTLSNPITQLDDFELLVQKIQSLAAQTALRY